MGVQTATTGNLDDAQNTIIAQCRYTQEHSDPCQNLIERFKLAQGQKQMTVPKVGSMTAQSLTDGVDLVDSEAIGLTSTDLTTGEVGLKVILTYKLLRQFNEDVFRIVGKQMGDAMSRKRDEDIIALFSGLNGGTTLGADGSYLNTNTAFACVAKAKGEKYPRPVSVVHHPYAIAQLAKQTAAIGATYYAGIMQGLSDDLLRNFWKISMDGVNFFEDGNVAKIGATDSGYGAIFSKSAMCIIESQAPDVKREEDISLRAWEVVLVSDYGCFELDDKYGAPMRYEIGALTTTDTST